MAPKPESAPTSNETTVQRTSDFELVVRRIFNAPADIVFGAWTDAALFKQWWVPKSMNMSLLSCEMDARVGSGYRLEFRSGDSGSVAFFGRYLEVIPHVKVVWTNDESADGPITTVTFEERDSATHLTLHERYPSKDALDAAGTSSAEAMGEIFGQLDELLIRRSANGSHPGSESRTGVPPKSTGDAGGTND